MIRRQFIKLAALTGATGLASMGSLKAVERDTKPAKTVTWHVRGFTCVTCAVGLETMLGRQKGVVSAKATYPEAMVTIQYHPGEVDKAALRSYISDLGFTAVEADERKG